MTLSEAAVEAGSQSYKSHLLYAESLFSSDSNHSRITAAATEADRSVDLIRSLPNAKTQVEPYRASALYHFLRGQAGEDDADSGADYQSALSSVQRAIALTESHTNWAELRRSNRAGFYSEADAMAFGTLYRLESAIYLRLNNSNEALADALKAREYAPLAALTYRAIAEAFESGGQYDAGAQALMEGIILTSDPYLRKSFGRLSRKSPELMSCVHARSDGDVDLNMSCPAMHRTSCSAVSELLEIVTNAGRGDLAPKITELGARQLACSMGGLTVQ